MSDDLTVRLRAVFAEDPAPEWRPLELPDHGERLLVAAPRQHGGPAPRLAALWEAATMGTEESARFERDYRRLRDQTHPRVLVDGVVYDLTPPLRSWPTFAEDPYPEVRAVAKKHLPTEREALAAQVARIFDIPRRMVDGRP